MGTFWLKVQFVCLNIACAINTKAIIIYLLGLLVKQIINYVIYHSNIDPLLIIVGVDYPSHPQIYQKPPTMLC